MVNVLVTGGAGFIGSHVVERAIGAKNQVWVIDNLVTGQPDHLQPFLAQGGLRFDAEDLRTFAGLQEAVNWADYIYHFAATVGMYNVIAFPAETLSNNIESCEVLLKAMTKANKEIRLLIASSSGVYCHSEFKHDRTLHEETPLKVFPNEFHQEAYSLSKIVNEVMGLCYWKEKKIHCTIARIFNTIGIRQSSAYGMVVPRFVEQALSGQPLTIFGDGSQSRSFCNVHDVVEALDLLLQDSQSIGDIFNVGNDDECSILELAKLVKKKTKSHSEIRFISYKEAYGIDFKDVQKRRPNIKKLNLQTKFRPKWSLEETLDEIILSKKGQ